MPSRAVRRREIADVLGLSVESADLYEAVVVEMAMVQA
jgi:hypothetical protein